MHFFKNLSLLCIITRYKGLEDCQKLFEIPLSAKKPMPVLFITPTTYRENPVTLIDYKKCFDQLKYVTMSSAIFRKTCLIYGILKQTVIIDNHCLVKWNTE